MGVLKDRKKTQTKLDRSSTIYMTDFISFPLLFVFSACKLYLFICFCSISLTFDSKGVGGRGVLCFLFVIGSFLVQFLEVTSLPATGAFSS